MHRVILMDCFSAEDIAVHYYRLHFDTDFVDSV